ncbi:MAG: DUF5777 family beta-barrel protein [Bacteroidota bacterium]
MFLSRIAIFQILLLFYAANAFAQDDLMGMLGDDEPTTEYTYATFKSTRVISGQSVENPAEGVLQFVVSHHFGRVNQGAYDLFGLDQATVKLDFQYGITDRLAVGIGRSSYQKTFDGFVKYKALRQSTGEKEMPVTLSYVAGADLNSLKWKYPDRDNHFSSRISYFHQLLLARKFNEDLSLQLSPTVIHKNLVETANDPNDIIALGAGGRYKLTQRFSLNAEYFYLLTEETANEFENVLSIGVDIETGGHVFQLHFTNAQPMFERGFISETRGKWADGDVYFGFNINRVFTIKKPEEFRD